METSPQRNFRAIPSISIYTQLCICIHPHTHTKPFQAGSVRCVRHHPIHAQPNGTTSSLSRG